MISSVSMPNRCTIALAVTSPIPLIIPLPRYASIPDNVAGASTSQLSALNCFP